MNVNPVVCSSRAARRLVAVLAVAAVLGAPAPARADHRYLRLCEHPDFKGWCLYVPAHRFNQSHLNDLHRYGWGDRISSFAAVPGGRPRSGIMLYEADHCDASRGARRFVDAVPNLNREGINDSASSVKVLSGTWDVCEHADYRGFCGTFRARPRCIQLGPALRNKVTSIRPHRGGSRREPLPPIRLTPEQLRNLLGGQRR